MNQEQYRKLNIYRKRFLKYDIVSSIVVFLVAIPLCLGIALASGAPLISGIISGIIGGVIVGLVSHSHVSVSGPAAGMAAVVLAALTQLGGFNVFLLALFLAGILQFVTGLFKAGFIAEYIPSNVIQGLLCAIGILLIIKQLPLAFSHSTEISELQTHLLETTEGLTLKPLSDLSEHINTGAVLISLISFSILFYFDRTKIARLKDFPAPILVVIAGILINELFIYTNSSLEQNTPQLVNIPTFNHLGEFLGIFRFPDWSAFKNPNVYLYAFILAIIASLESLLNLKASERLDKKRRYSSKNRELLAQGLGNITAGLVGGIPVTSVIIRTSVNIQSGAKTKVSTVLHGFFILFSVMLIPDVLNKIPLSSLAVILIHTGYKLTRPAIYKNMYKQGLDRFIPFIVTIISIVIFNLLTGILIGLGFSLFYLLKSHSQTRFDIIKEKYPSGDSNRLILPQQVSFLNKASLIAELDALPINSTLIIDASDTAYIDKEILELINDFKNGRAQYKKITINLTGFKDHYDIHNYIDYINVTTYDIQQSVSPAEVLTILNEGNQRFLNDTRIHRRPRLDIQQTAEAQHPLGVVLGCIDSRVPVETIFDMSFGDLFCIRVAGNVVNQDILASMEYGCNVAGAKLILVLGHIGCGAIHAACDDVKKGLITQLLDKIKPAIQAVQKISGRAIDPAIDCRKVTEFNIGHTLLAIYQQSSILKEMLDNDEIAMAGALYDINSGKVYFQDYSKMLKYFDGKDSEILSIKLQQLLHEAKL